MYFMRIYETRILLFLFLCVTACDGQRIVYRSPSGYDFSKPVKFNMPESLHEISGIAFDKTNNDTIYAEQDEEGKLFHFKLGDKKMIVSKFGKPGDFEDVTICNGVVIMLRSDGTLYDFPLSQANNAKVEKVQEWKGLLPAGEFEGMASIDSGSQVFVLCKHCGDEKASKKTGVYFFTLDEEGKLIPQGNAEIRVKEIESLLGVDKMHFHPSALTFNPFTREWYILSSVNGLLVITDNHWQVKDVFPLDHALFPQPEGIAMDSRRNLYISNERNTRDYGTILKFMYQKK